MNSVGCLSLELLNWANFFSLPSQRNFPISFKPKVAIAKFIGKMQKKSGTYYEKWVGRHASFTPRRSVKQILFLINYFECVHSKLQYFSVHSPKFLDFLPALEGANSPRKMIILCSLSSLFGIVYGGVRLCRHRST